MKPDGAVQAVPPAAARIRTRLLVNEQDARVLRMLGRYLGALLNAELARFCAGPAAPEAPRRRVLTAQTSSRWAGSIMRTARALYYGARGAQHTALRRTGASARTIQARLAAPLRDDAQKPESPRPGGYRSQHERAMKQRRLRILQARADKLRADLSARRVHVCRGGKKMARRRHYLPQAGLTLEQWREQWEAQRCFIHALGEAGKRYGNETIRVSACGDGLLNVEVFLPSPLRHLANAPRGRYRLMAKSFGYRGDEWLAHVAARRACAYDISYDPAKGRWYLGASFRLAPDIDGPAWDSRAPGRVLGVDLNGDHLAAAVLDPHGNPCGRSRSISLEVHGLPASTRDGHLRDAVTKLLRLAQEHACTALVCEDLDFERLRATIREEGTRPKRVRSRIMGIPTRQFRERLVAMASRQGLAVVGVPSGNSTAWGEQHWLKALKDVQRAATRHHASAVVLGRRAQGHGARRRGEVTASQRSMEAAPRSSRRRGGGLSPRLSRGPRARGTGPPRRRPGGGTPRKTGTGDGNAAQFQAAQDRSERPVGGIKGP